MNDQPNGPTAAVPDRTVFAREMMRSALLIFVVEYKSSTRPAYVIARQAFEGAWSMPPRPLLGGVPIHASVTQPRALTTDGRPRVDLFVFTLLRKDDVAHLTVGEQVSLTSSEEQLHS